MSTVSTDGINTGGEGLWVSVSELARQRGVDKAAISRQVNRLEELGAVKTQCGPRGSKLVNVAEFDKASGRTTDAIRQLNGGGTPALRAAAPLSPNELVLSEQQARRAAYDADLKKLELDERLGKLVSIDEIKATGLLIAEALGRKIDQLPTYGDEIASAVVRDGAQGARVLLRKIAIAQRTAFADEMRKLGRPTPPADAAGQTSGA